mgnify:CR=1 FL=1
MGEWGSTEERAFFGRRHGKTLRDIPKRALDETLPRYLLAPDADLSNPAALFRAPVDRVGLEIGFGGGEHLHAATGAEPGVGLIGAEAFVNGLARLAVLLEQAPRDNLVVHADDVVKLLDRLPEACLDVVHLYYPDPWRKRRHWKRRFLGADNVARLGRVLKPGRRLLFATDWANYAAHGLSTIRADGRFRWSARAPEDWKTPWPGWVSTRYEAKAIREGRAPSYLAFERV